MGKPGVGVPAGSGVGLGPKVGEPSGVVPGGGVPVWPGVTPGVNNGVTGSVVGSEVSVRGKGKVAAASRVIVGDISGVASSVGIGVRDSNVSRGDNVGNSSPAITVRAGA